MKAKDLHKGRLYRTAEGDARFTDFDIYGFAVCDRLSDGVRLALTLKQVLEPIRPAPALSPATPSHPTEGGPCL